MTDIITLLDYLKLKGLASSHLLNDYPDSRHLALNSDFELYSDLLFYKRIYHIDSVSLDVILGKIELDGLGSSLHDQLSGLENLSLKIGGKEGLFVGKI